MAQKTDTIFLTTFDLADPEIVKAAQLLEREGLAKVVGLAPGLPRPPEPLLYVVPQDMLQRVDIYGAFEKVLPQNAILRDDKETPSMSLEHSRARGFGDDEIKTRLMPWIAAAEAAAQARVDETKKAHEAAIAEAAALYEASQKPLEEPFGGMHSTNITEKEQE